MNHFKSYVFIAVGAVNMLIFSLFLIKGVEPFQTWFYSLIWWSYLVFLTGLVSRLGGRAILFSDPKKFLFLTLLSAPLWFTFEIFNVRLEDWKYVGVPHQIWLRWSGYFLAFGTVVPAIFQTAEGVNIRLPLPMRERAGVRGKPHPPHPNLLPRWGEGVLITTGIVCLILPLLWPHLFFPLVWVGFFFLLDPLNAARGWPSLLREWSRGDFNTTLSLLISGGLCGILWEFWNFRAGAKWVYTLPFWGSPKVFEMPLAGYLGFLPFALECYAVVGFARELYDGTGKMGHAIFWSVLVLLSLAGCWSVDQFTVKSFQ